MVDTLLTDESEKAVVKSFQTILTSLFSLAENDIIDLSTIRRFKLLLGKHHSKNTILTSINKLIATKLLSVLNDIKTNEQFASMRLSSTIMAFLTLLLNVKEYFMFTLAILAPDSETRNALVKIIENSQSLLIKQILAHLFLSEYKSLFFLNPPVNYLETLFIEIAVFFANINNSFGIETAQEDVIISSFESILKFKLDYDDYFQDNSFGLTEKSKMKYMICHSIIRLILSKHNNSKYTKSTFYLCDYITTLVDKDMLENKNKYGDKYSVLFRKEIIYDDIIKHFFFLFGSEVINKALIEVLLKYVNENDKTVDTDVLENILKEMCFNTLQYLPEVLKYLLKTVLIKSQEFFSFSDGKVYSPLFTLLLFNFYLSPKVQELHGLVPNKYPILIKINRLLRNICYNQQFDFKDELAPFNLAIENYHNYLTEIFVKLLEIDYYSLGSKEEIDKRLHQTQDVIIPKFLFDVDCSVMAHFIKGKPIIVNNELFIK